MDKRCGVVLAEYDQGMDPQESFQEADSGRQEGHYRYLIGSIIAFVTATIAISPWSFALGVLGFALFVTHMLLAPSDSSMCGH